MAARIKGITITLYERTQTGTNAFNAPIYKEIPVAVENVLVSPLSSDAVLSELQMSGKHAVYELCIPKGDTHTWEDRRVEFFGSEWHTFGAPLRLIDELVPLDWNLRIKVERYG